MSNYNIFSMLPELPYNIVSYLIENNDLIFRLLKFNDSDAWRLDTVHPNLSQIEKGNLVYDGLRVESDCKIFLDTGADESWQQQSSILRISILEAIPSNYVYGYLVIGAEIYCHYKINTLTSYKPRDLTIAQSLIETLNGAEVGGIGKLFFDSSINPRSKLTTFGNAPFKAKAILFCNWAV
jgi:hypothetical protein